MSRLFDHIAATVVGGTVILLLSVISLRGQETTADSTQFVTAKARMIEWARRVEQDLNNVGSGLTDADLAAGRAFEWMKLQTNKAFSFRLTPVATVSSDDPAVAHVPDDAHYPTIGPGSGTRLVCYEKQLTGRYAQVLTSSPSPKPRYKRVPLFRIVRKEAPGSASDCSGGTVTDQSAPTLTQFDIHLRTADGTSTNKADAVRTIDIDMRMVSPLDGGQTEATGGWRQHIDQTRWSRVFRPANLSRIGP